MKPTPEDWSQPVTAHGVYRNAKLFRYDVKITVAGKQHYVGVAYDQRSASRMYDAALFKLCPKISRRLTPNADSRFSSFTQEVVDIEYPNLFRLYPQLPFLRPEHATVSERVLRDARLAQWLVQDNTFKPDVASPYDRLSNQLRNLAAKQLTDATRLKNSLSKVPYSNKLPEVVRRLATVLDTYRVLQENTELAAASMEQNKTYYEQTASSKIGG